jgi:uncharacterized protein DUF4154
MSPALTTQRTPRRSFLLFLWRGALLLMMLGALGIARPAYGAASVSESELKAAFLYNFAKFVTWPTSAFPSETAPIQVAVFGDEEFSIKLKELLNDKKAHGRSFEVKRILSPFEAKNFQMVFVTSAENRRAPMLLEVTKKLPVLTIGESDQFLEWGGMINFVFEEAQLRFEINTEPAEKVKLEISSKLLRLAKKRSPK